MVPGGEIENFWVAERFPGDVVTLPAVTHDKASSAPRRDTDKDQELLRRLRERLQQIKRRLTDIEARVAALRTTEKAVTLREFTEKQLNGERPDDQETYASHPRTAAEKYTTS